MRKGNRKCKKKKNAHLLGLLVVMSVSICVAATLVIFLPVRENTWIKPEELLTTYMEHVQNRDYEAMYAMLAKDVTIRIRKEEFTKRNSAIYEGMETQNMNVTILSYDSGQNIVKFKNSFDTRAGSVSFENEARFVKEEGGYKLLWKDSLIFPGLASSDKVRIQTIPAERGNIVDRNDRVLAGFGKASSVGIVPGKLKNKDRAIKKIAGLLEIKPEEIQNKLSAKWVKDDSLVPIKILRNVQEIELRSVTRDREAKKEYDRQQKLLDIDGIMISDTEIRKYPFGEAAAHVVGYVQNVTAEDLEKHRGEGYTSNSVMGKSGLELVFERELKGQDGCEIRITDSDGREKEVIAQKKVIHGDDIKVTLDSELQTALYEQFKKDKSCSAAMDPYTGEILALVSTPSYDNNDFILGLSNKKWTKLNEDKKKPLYNRFRQVWCPGSVFKPITAAIGLESGAVDPREDYGNEGRSWQKDISWGAYRITTLHTYKPVILENALIYSDNIYFAKAALKIGAKQMEKSLSELGFHEKIPFEIEMTRSQYSNTDEIESEIQLADSGYGQGQVLVNPVHLASIYSAFSNRGSVIKPRIVYEEEADKEFWLPQVFSETTVDTVLHGMKKVVNDPKGTGYAAHRKDIVLAGKTGTAEIKADKNDTSGTELGWFAVFTPEKTARNPILLVSMVEDVKGRGGSGYVVAQDRKVLENWLKETK